MSLAVLGALTAAMPHVTVSRVQNFIGGTIVSFENLACPRETTGIALQTTQGVARARFLTNRVWYTSSFAPKRDFSSFYADFL